jgi:hypothetical protein
VYVTELTAFAMACGVPSIKSPFIVNLTDPSVLVLKCRE